MKVIWFEEAWEDYVSWQTQDNKTIKTKVKKDFLAAEDLKIFLQRKQRDTSSLYVRLILY